MVISKNNSMNKPVVSQESTLDKNLESYLYRPRSMVVSDGLFKQGETEARIVESPYN